jgi:hypothetical protein
MSPFLNVQTRRGPHLHERFEQYINGSGKIFIQIFPSDSKKILWEARSTPTLEYHYYFSFLFFLQKYIEKKIRFFFLFYEKLRKGLFDIKVFFVFFIEKSSSLESLFKSFLKDVCYDLIL